MSDHTAPTPNPVTAPTPSRGPVNFDERLQAPDDRCWCEAGEGCDDPRHCACGLASCCGHPYGCSGGHGGIRYPAVGGFEQMLADPNEQFDTRSEVLASILRYASALPASAGNRPAARAGGSVTIPTRDDGRAEVEWWRAKAVGMEYEVARLRAEVAAAEQRALAFAADFLARVTEIGETPRNEISDEDWEFYCANPLQTRAEIANWLRARAAAVADA